MECTPNREALLALIHPGLKLTKEFLKRTYAFDMNHSGFSEEVIAALEGIGCVRAREHYDTWVQEYESRRDAELKEAGHWYRLECEREWAKKQKGSEERRVTHAEAELLKQKKRLLMQKSQTLTGS